MIPAYPSGIRVIDLFAGPGGLSEGFSRLSRKGKQVYKICLSIEKDDVAHKTLLLRSFVRQFLPNHPPFEYYEYVRGNITREELFHRHKLQAEEAMHEVLGQPRELGNLGDDRVIRTAVCELRKRYVDQPRVLIGGPPCQAYSLAGRSRRAREVRSEFERDEKHTLYREYLEIVRLWQPTVFIMENVKGLLSATFENRKVFQRILDDLAGEGYLLYSLSQSVSGLTAGEDPSAFIVKAEEYGIPQRRHRLFVVGVLKGVDRKPGLLKRVEPISVRDAICDLPHIRSHISRRTPKQGLLKGAALADSIENWRAIIRDHVAMTWFDQGSRKGVQKLLHQLGDRIVDSKEFIDGKPQIRSGGALESWCRDDHLGGVLHHCGRSHRADDLLRYFFVSAIGEISGTSPKLESFPRVLWPDHANVTEDAVDIPHADRFKVQIGSEPSGTITCHISKDGHYYIHPDPTQCRSLTVREAARLQTFPDNYFFEGPRTEQYRQVGNAVPPLLAFQIAQIIGELLQ